MLSLCFLPVRFGLDFLASGHLPWHDPYSFTSDQAWINHEWLWDVVSAAVYRAGGLPALVVFRAVLAGIVLWVVDRASPSDRDGGDSTESAGRVSWLSRAARRWP